MPGGSVGRDQLAMAAKVRRHWFNPCRLGSRGHLGANFSLLLYTDLIKKRKPSRNNIMQHLAFIFPPSQASCLRVAIVPECMSILVERPSCMLCEEGLGTRLGRIYVKASFLATTVVVKWRTDMSIRLPEVAGPSVML